MQDPGHYVCGVCQGSYFEVHGHKFICATCDSKWFVQGSHPLLNGGRCALNKWWDDHVLDLEDADKGEVEDELDELDELGEGE